MSLILILSPQLICFKSIATLVNRISIFYGMPRIKYTESRPCTKVHYHIAKRGLSGTMEWYECYNDNTMNWNTVYTRIYPNVSCLHYCSHRTVEANWAAISEANGRSVRHKVYRIALVANKMPKLLSLN